MQLNEQTIPIETIGSFESIKFDIKFDSKMVNLLSSTLYANKIRALIRELGCNAQDSNIAANSTRPIDIELPSRFNNNFVIRDYGIGLNPERIKEIYTIYGVSDKTTSNKLTGALGLGSKTPLCYHTKTATIDSYVDGKHWSYQFHLGEDGIPCLTKLLEEATQEPNGVKITVPIAPGDMYTFSSEAREVYQWFDPKPNVTPKLEYPTYKDMVGHKILNRTSVLMGGVLYPVDYVPLNLNADLKIIYNCNILLEVQIGEVEPAISREALSYTDHTKNTIKKYLDDVRKQIVSIDLYKDCKNLHDAKLAWLRSGLPQVFKPLFPFNGQHFDLTFGHNELLYNIGGRFEKTGRWYYRDLKDIPIYLKDCWNAKQRINQLNQQCYLLMTDDQKVLDELNLEKRHLINASTLSYTRTKRQKFTGLASKKWDGRSWQPERINDTDKVIYITGDNAPDRHYFRSVFNNAKILDDNLAVHFLSNKVHEKIKDKPNFVLLDDHIKKLIQTKQKALETYDKFRAISRYNIIKELVSKPSTLPQKIKDELQDYIGLKIGNNYDAIYQVALSLKLYKPQEHTVIEDFMKKYPLLEYLTWCPVQTLLKEYLEKVV